MSGWPLGYQSTVINGLCDSCGLLKRIRQYIAGWVCKDCAKRHRSAVECQAFADHEAEVFEQYMVDVRNRIGAAS